MGKLNYKYATMNSGKTLDLIRTAHNYEENDFKVIVLKPVIDTKGNDLIVSRVGISRKVDFLIASNDKIVDVLKHKLDNITCILIDEAQFLEKKQINELFLISHMTDIEVICYGLRTNFKMEAFKGSKRLLEIADELEEIKTMCHCGKIARYVGRKVNGAYVLEGKEVIIDGEDNVQYIPLCGECYLLDVNKYEKEKVKKLLR